MKRFIPLGYEAAELAVRRISEAIAPEAWSSIPPAEQPIWDLFLGADLLATLLAHLQSKDRQPAEIDPARMRYIRLMDAAHELKKRLYSGSLTAWSLNENLELVWIERTGWAEDASTQALMTGVDAVVGDVTNVYGRHRVFLPTKDVDAIVAEMRGEHVQALSDSRIDAAYPRSEDVTTIDTIPALEETNTAHGPMDTNEESAARRTRGATITPHIRSWLENKYPGGLPTSLPRKTLLVELKSAGIEASSTSLQRAIQAIQTTK